MPSGVYERAPTLFKTLKDAVGARAAYRELGHPVIDTMRVNDKNRQREKRARYPDKKAEENRLYRERNREKVKAHDILNKAIKNGEVLRGSCLVCHSEKAQGHHPDYSKPLAVRWLCASHHKLEHLNVSGRNKN